MLRSMVANGQETSNVQDVLHWTERVRIGCVYEAQPADTLGLLVTRARPRRSARAQIDAWWPLLAPSRALLEAPRVNQRGLGWDLFAARYRAELDGLPPAARLGARLLIAQWLRRVTTVTLLTFERTRDRGIEQDRSQRRVLLEWLTDE